MINGFRSYHPVVQFFYYLYAGTLALYINHPLFLITAVILLIFINYTHNRGETLRQWLPLLLTMSIVIIMLNPLLVKRGTTIVFTIKGKQIFLESFVYGITMAVSIVLLLLIFMSFNFVLNGHRFLFIISQKLPRTALLLMLTIRFIPLLKNRLDEISDVHRIRGFHTSEGSMHQRLNRGMLRLQVLLTWSFEEAIQTADAMKLRGYGSGKRSSYIMYPMEKQDWRSLFLLSLLFMICLIGGSLGYGKITIYPKLGNSYLYSLDWGFYFFYILIFSFPLLIEGREQLRWIFYK